jgi:hypothetical protein
VQRTVNDHASYMTRVRTKYEMNGVISKISLSVHGRL